MIVDKIFEAFLIFLTMYAKMSCQKVFHDWKTKMPITNHSYHLARRLGQQGARSTAVSTLAQCLINQLHGQLQLKLTKLFKCKKP